MCGAWSHTTLVASPATPHSAFSPVWHCWVPNSWSMAPHANVQTTYTYRQSEMWMFWLYLHLSLVRDAECADRVLLFVAGHYCDIANEPVASYTPYPCPVGYYCPNSTKWSTQYACPLGTYNPNTKLETVDQCTSCDAGKYCSGVGNTVTTSESLTLHSITSYMFISAQTMWGGGRKHYIVPRGVALYHTCSSVHNLSTVFTGREVDLCITDNVQIFPCKLSYFGFSGHFKLISRTIWRWDFGV